MNLTVIRLTMRALLGRRRAVLLLILPAVLLGLAGLTRWASGGTPDASASLTAQFAMGTLLPLMCLLISTGVIGAEIDDGSIVYMLAKPIPRRTIVFSKLAVAIGASFAFAVVPTVVAVTIAGDEGGKLALAFGVSTALAAIAYSALFVALSIASRNAVIFGLLYALLWETVLGGYVPGIRAVSVRQWAMSVGERMLGDNASAWGVSAEVGIVTGVIMLVVATSLAVFAAVRKLQTLRLTSAE
jgi:ABC-2 type transport system permease protein